LTDGASELDSPGGELVLVQVVPENDSASDSLIAVESDQTTSMSVSETSDSPDLAQESETESVVAVPEIRKGPMEFVRRQVSRVVNWFKQATKGFAKVFSVNVPDDD